jgi:hypothetical protein
MNTLFSAATAPGLVVAAVDPAEVKPGWLALVIVLLMCLATFLLWRSMNHQLKKVDFDDGSRRDADGAREAPDAAPGARGAAAADESAPGGPASNGRPAPDGGR